MGTGEDDDGNRAELSERQTEWQHLHFDHTKIKARGYDAAMNIRLVADHVSRSIRNDIYQTNRGSYTDEQAAVALYVIELAVAVSM
jgi:hypothetical protein